MTDEIRLSRGFETTAYDYDMPDLELYVKSPIALALGILPFTVSYLAMAIFRPLASATGFLAHQREKTDGLAQFAFSALHAITGSVTMATSALMMGATKLFSLSQTIVWGHYVEKPQGDGPNTRLAQYGSGSKPWEDLQGIAKALFCPASLPEKAWQLRHWSQVQI